MIWWGKPVGKLMRIIVPSALFFTLASETLNAKQFISDEEDQKISDLKECLDWFITDEADQYTLKVKNFPVENMRDLEGDLKKIFDKLEKIRNDPKCSLIRSELNQDIELFKKGFNSFPEDFKKKLILASHEYPTNPGDKVPFILLFGIFEGRIPDMDPKAFLEYMASVPQGQNQVIWNGQSNRYEYRDSDLEYRIITITHWIKEQGESFFAQFKALDPEIKKSWMINTNSSDPITHVEPLDLIQGSIVRGIAALQNVKLYGGVSRIVLTKAVHRFLYRQFELTADQDPRGAVLSDVSIAQDIQMRDPLKSVVICAGNGHIEGLKEWQMVPIPPLTIFMVNSQEINQAQNSQDGSVVVKCHDQSFPLKSTPVAATPLPLPKPFDVKEIVDRHGTFNVLVTYSLTEETTNTLIGATIAFMQSHGFLLGQVERGQSTVPTFERYFVDTDLLIPAAHSIDVTKFPIGTARSRVLHFWKIQRTQDDYRRIPIHLVAIFPEEQGQTGGLSEPLGLDKLAELFSARRINRPHSLFSLTLSCYSPGAAIYWTNAYRRSLDIDIALGRLDSISHAQDLVHAIAPKGGFPTHLPSDLLMDMVPALKAVDMIGSGHSVKQVFERFSGIFRPDWFIKAIIQIERWFKIEVPPYELKLNPVYNFEIPNLLNSTGYILEVGSNDLVN
jgi:hypothetical protein